MLRPKSGIRSCHAEHFCQEQHDLSCLWSLALWRRQPNELRQKPPINLHLLLLHCGPAIGNKNKDSNDGAPDDDVAHGDVKFYIDDRCRVMGRLWIGGHTAYCCTSSWQATPPSLTQMSRTRTRRFWVVASPSHLISPSAAGTSFGSSLWYVPAANAARAGRHLQIQIIKTCKKDSSEKNK